MSLFDRRPDSEEVTFYCGPYYTPDDEVERSAVSTLLDEVSKAVAIGVQSSVKVQLLPVDEFASDCLLVADPFREDSLFEVATKLLKGWRGK